MRGSLGQPIIIENVTGADGTIGVGKAARAKTDGNTISIGTGSIKAFAVTSDARVALALDIPTFAEFGLPALSWSGLVWAFRSQGHAKGCG